MNPRGCETDAGRSAGLAGLDVQLVFTYALTTAQSPSMMTSMDRPSDQLQYPRASVSSVRVTAPASPEMYHRPFQTPRTSTSSPALCLVSATRWLRFFFLRAYASCPRQPRYARSSECRSFYRYALFTSLYPSFPIILTRFRCSSQRDPQGLNIFWYCPLETFQGRRAKALQSTPLRNFQPGLLEALYSRPPLCRSKLFTIRRH